MLKNILQYASLSILFLLILASPKIGLAKYNLTILHTNDLHSHLNKFPRLVTAIEKIKKVKAEKGDPVLLLDSGDFMIGTLYHLLTTTYSPELTLMHTLGYDAVTLGNHEFDWGPEVLAKTINVARENGEGRTVPIIASNVQFNLFDTRDDALKKLYERDIIRPYLVKTLPNGLKVGIIGILGKKAREEAPGVPPVGFIHNIEFIQRRVSAVRRKGVDLLICLSHSGIEEDKKLARLIKGIDIIIAGHCHTALFEPIYIDNTLIVEAGSYANYLGKLEVFIEKGKVNVRGYKLIPIDDSILEDPALKRIITDYKDIIDREILSPIGLESSKTLAEVDFNLIAEGKKMLESNLGDLAADAMRFAIDSVEQEDPVDFAFQPTGFLRGNIYKGEIRVSDVFRVSPLGTGPKKIGGWPLVSFYLNAKEIKRILEISIFLTLTRRKDYFLQISGLRFSYNPLRPNFKKVTRIERWDSDLEEYILLDTSDTETLYKVGTNLFLLNLSFITRYIPGLAITPKDRDGSPIFSHISKGKVKTIVDRKLAGSLSQEIREWQAFMSYISHFPDLDGDLIPDVPSRYAKPQDRVNLDYEEILNYYSSKKDPLIGVGAALLFPSLGHAYANNWYPKGFMFILAELASVLIASQESTKIPGLFLLASFKILECKDAYNSVIDYNKRLEETLRISLLADQNKIGFTLMCKF